MKYYDRFCSGLSRVILGICSLLMVILLCCSALQVTSRYVFGSSITWTEEAARYCFIWLDMLGASVLVYKGGHAVVDLLVHKLHGTARKIYETAVHVLVAYAGIILARFGAALSSLTFRQTSPSLKLPMGAVYGAMSICGVLVVIFTVNQLIHVWTGQKVTEEVQA